MPYFKILVISPTELELSFLTPVIHKFGVKTGICGVGPAASAFGITRLVIELKADMVVMVGIGGTYEPETIAPGIAVIAGKEVFGDLGRCNEDGIEPVVIAGQKLPRHYEMVKKWPFHVKSAISTSTHLVDMVTVSCSSGSRTRGQMMKKLYSSQVENMEGASGAMVCEHYGIPFVEIRGISNEAGDPDKNNWRISEAMKAATSMTESFLSMVSNDR